MAERRGRAYDGSEEVPNTLGETTQIRVPVVTFDIKLTDRLGLQAGASIPDVTRSAGRFSENFSGIGDTSLLGWYRLPRLSGWNAMLNAGVSIPTGKTETPRFRPELRDGSLVPMSRLQRGSGTFDPTLGLNVSRVHFKTGLTLFGSVAARTPLYENSEGLRTGAASEINSGVAHELISHNIVGIARLGWLHREQDQFNGTPVLVGGGNWLYFTPGINVQIISGINIQTDVKIPIYRRLSNMQLDSPAVFQIGISREF